jgi:hypothetical protein
MNNNSGSKQTNVAWKLKVWRKIFAPLDLLTSSLEKQRLRKSIQSPFFSGHGRDSFRYYIKGRSVDIWAEILTNQKYQRMVARDPVLKWNDNKQVLTQEEKQEVLQKFYDYLDHRGKKWIYADETKKFA